MLRFYEVYCEVEPKRLALEKANAELKAARDKLEIVNKQVAVRRTTSLRLEREKEEFLFLSSNWKRHWRSSLLNTTRPWQPNRNARMKLIEQPTRSI